MKAVEKPQAEDEPPQDKRETIQPTLTKSRVRASASGIRNDVIAVEKSCVFTYLLKTCLPLPDTWSFKASSNAVTLSLKIVVSTLLSESFKAFVEGDNNALESFSMKLSAVIVSLSEFLLAQTKITIHKKNLEKTDLADDDVLDLENLDISTSNSVGTIKKKERELTIVETDYNLKPFQRLLIKSLIQYFSDERCFVKKLIETISIGYDLQVRYPFEWLIHPMYVFREDTCVLDVCFNENVWEYGHEFHSVKEDCVLTPENERSLFWLASGIKQHEFGSILETKVLLQFCFLQLQTFTKL